jgi:hypothetical protein
LFCLAAYLDVRFLHGHKNPAVGIPGLSFYDWEERGARIILGDVINVSENIANVVNSLEIPNFSNNFTNA